MKIGRIRVRTDARIASFGVMPSSRMWLSDWCTIRIGLFTTVPIRITKPSIVSTSSVCGT